MKKNIYLLKEFIPVAGVSESQIKEWESLKILIPSGYTEDKTACYSDDSIKRAEHIKQLTALGYNLDDIQKIIKKVGLPSHTEDKNQPKEADKYLTVGHLSEAVGISTRTIKHWEEKGIIEPQMRSQGGFRLYPESYIYLCKLIVDLQLFGYTLDEIKIVSDHFREFLTIKQEIENMPYPEVDKKLRNMLNKIKTLTGQIDQLKSGIQRWEDLLKKKKKEINQLINKNDKKIEQDKSNKPIKK